jgi:hypothetical protein
MISMLLSVASTGLSSDEALDICARLRVWLLAPGVALLIKAEGLRGVALIGSLQIVVMNGPRSLA